MGGPGLLQVGFIRVRAVALRREALRGSMVAVAKGKVDRESAILVLLCKVLCRVKRRYDDCGRLFDYPH